MKLNWIQTTTGDFEAAGFRVINETTHMFGVWWVGITPINDKVILKARKPDEVKLMCEEVADRILIIADTIRVSVKEPK